MMLFQKTNREESRCRHYDAFRRRQRKLRRLERAWRDAVGSRMLSEQFAKGYRGD
jgi:hypothetical protein